MNVGVRLNINRNNYKIPTGLYEFGQPSEDSPVLVTGNYKLTFDYLRKSLKKDYWVLIIDTDGINVWCAAGKGRFGSAEVIRMLRSVKLPVSHNEIILPQLSAPGIQSHLITKITGKKVIFGPIRISDMDDFVETGIREDMRKVTFTLKDRMLLVPLELIASLKYLIAAFLVGLIPYFPAETFWIFLTASLLGNLVHTLLLPILPFRKFYLNGALLSLCLLPFLQARLLSIGVVMLGMLYSSFLAMNFTGSTTFTSLSGVKKEMAEAIPRMIIWGTLSILLIIIGLLMEVL